MKVLSRQEEKTATIDMLIESNLRFAYSEALRFSEKCTVPLEDLIQQGTLGLYEAAKRYDPEMGYRFITYAVWWIRQRMGEYFARDDLIRQPAGHKKRMRYTYLSLEADGKKNEKSLPSLYNRLNAGNAAPADTLLEVAEEREHVGKLLTMLPPKEADVLRKYYGFEGGESWTLATLGEHHKISRERVRQIKNRALRRCRKILVELGRESL